MQSGFWAAAAQESDFAGHVIFKCLGPESCLRGGVCAAGRSGRACGDCVAGYYGTLDGPCKRCLLGGPAVYQSLALFAFVALTFALIPMHRVTEGGRRDPQNPSKRSRREMLCALSLVVKYAQRVVVLSSFPCSGQRMSLQLRRLTSLQGLMPTLCRPSASVVWLGSSPLSFLSSCRWFTPVVLSTACLLASPGSRVIGLFLKMCGSTKLHKFGESAPFGAVSACTLIVELYILFSTSAINNSISLMICRQGPSVMTVVAFRSSSAPAKGGGD